MIKIKLLAQQSWLMAKKFWWAIVIGLLVLCAGLVSWATRNAGLLSKALEMLDAKKDAHDQEMETLAHIHNTEIAEKNLRLEEHLRRRDELKERFEKNGEALTKQKEAELKKIVDESYNDPDELAKKLAEAFGL
jgi:cell division protein FtsL